MYIADIGKTSMTDFRFIYKADFKLLNSQQDPEHLAIALQAVKPSRFKM